jgi:hypothetical protein
VQSARRSLLRASADAEKALADSDASTGKSTGSQPELASRKRRVAM